MKIKVKWASDYWEDGTSDKVVFADEVELSADLYLCDEEILGDGAPSRIVRLISGIRGSTELGFHFDEDWVTVCPINTEYAIFRGVRKSKIKKVEVTNNALLEILRET